jgi:hypothetical protein
MLQQTRSPNSEYQDREAHTFAWAPIISIESRWASLYEYSSLVFCFWQDIIHWHHIRNLFITPETFIEQ